MAYTQLRVAIIKCLQKAVLQLQPLTGDLPDIRERNVANEIR